MIVTEALNEHIVEKISFHEQKRVFCESIEDYEQCVYHRNEIKRLKDMLH